jgi:hypothetical protein
MNDVFATLKARPLSRRPENGFAAWQMTLAYIAARHSPDAILQLRAYPRKDERILWSASVSWGQNYESVNDLDSLPSVLSELWKVVDHNHNIFDIPEEAARSPAGYESHNWVDVNVQEILHRLLWTTRMVFDDDWSMIIVYQPAEIPALRVQMRLLAQGNTLCVGGRGASLVDAARELYRHAAPHYFAHSQSRASSEDDAER